MGLRNSLRLPMPLTIVQRGGEEREGGMWLYAEQRDSITRSDVIEWGKRGLIDIIPLSCPPCCSPPPRQPTPTDDSLFLGYHSQCRLFDRIILLSCHGTGVVPPSFLPPRLDCTPQVVACFPLLHPTTTTTTLHRPPSLNFLPAPSVLHPT
jgi:hypothetical protein